MTFQSPPFPPIFGHFYKNSNAVVVLSSIVTTAATMFFFDIISNHVSVSHSLVTLFSFDFLTSFLPLYLTLFTSAFFCLPSLTGPVLLLTCFILFYFTSHIYLFPLFPAFNFIFYLYFFFSPCTLFCNIDYCHFDGRMHTRPTHQIFFFFAKRC